MTAGAHSEDKSHSFNRKRKQTVPLISLTHTGRDGTHTAMRTHTAMFFLVNPSACLSSRITSVHPSVCTRVPQSIPPSSVPINGMNGGGRDIHTYIENNTCMYVCMSARIQTAPCLSLDRCSRQQQHIHPSIGADRPAGRSVGRSVDRAIDQLSTHTSRWTSWRPSGCSIPESRQRQSPGTSWATCALFRQKAPSRPRLSWLTSP
mmetsp:Transcript_6835/g.16614  ORF Transcript_6835/g.16614 Transcript_6835/m.16614 type:complete len:205 (-) Transcript_6835:585-1199(-)